MSARPAGDRRRRLRQDQHAGASGGASDRQQGRSAPHPADDLFAARGRRDGAPGRTHRAQGVGRQRRRHDRRSQLGRDVPRHRRATVARICRADRDRSGLHDPRPRGFGRPHEPGAARTRPVQDRTPLSDQRHLPCDLLALRQRRDFDRAGARDNSFRGVRAGAANSSNCSPPMSKPSRSRTCSITTISCFTGRR